MKRFNPYQIEILRKIAAGGELFSDDLGWHWEGGAKADGRAAWGMLRRIPQWIIFRAPNGSAAITDAGRAVLAEAQKEGT